jgi:hypothetical protein
VLLALPADLGLLIENSVFKLYLTG